MPRRMIGLRLDPKIVSPDPEPVVPIPPPTIVFGWGAAYKVGTDIPEGSTIKVDFSDILGVIGVAAAVQEFKGLDFGIGGPSSTPWQDAPFNGSIASSGTVDASRQFHVTLGVVAGHDFRLAGWKGMQVATKRHPNAIDWFTSDGWPGTEYHADGGIVGEGGVDLFSHLGWRFVDQDAGTTDVGVSIELVDTTTGEEYVYGFCDISTSGTVDVNSGFDISIHPNSNIISVPLTHDIIAPSGLAIMTAMIVNDDIWSGDDASYWPNLSDSTDSPSNFGKGRVLTAMRFPA